MMEALKYKHSFMNLRNWQHTRKQLNSLNHKAHEVGVIIPGLKNDHRVENGDTCILMQCDSALNR